MSNFLRPHSKAWFEELEIQNPNQAAQTKQIISLAGSEEVCSICGDNEANDYKLEGSQATPGMAVTLKLCDDCLNIRKKMHGENFVPFIH
ncbi:MAG: hypothetical protein IIB77_04285 [Proteobacteria bacterium]|nr:hypothetical protein [Pseudomonadota bacterium]